MHRTRFTPKRAACGLTAQPTGVPKRSRSQRRLDQGGIRDASGPNRGPYCPKSRRRDGGAGEAVTRPVVVHNEAQGGWVLLAPERVFKADPIAAEIIKRCTGEATFGEIVDDLAKTYAAPRDKILADVGTLLRGLADKKLLEV